MAKFKVAEWLHAELSELQSAPVFVAENVILDITEQICAAMDKCGVKQKDLAARLEVSPSAVSQMLSGDQNLSIRRLVEVALALGMTITPPQLVPQDVAQIEAVENDTLLNPTLDAQMMSFENARSLWERTGTWEYQTSTKKSLAVPKDTEAANDYSYSFELAA